MCVRVCVCVCVCVCACDVFKCSHFLTVRVVLHSVDVDWLGLQGLANIKKEVLEMDSDHVRAEIERLIFSVADTILAGQGMSWWRLLRVHPRVHLRERVCLCRRC